MIKDHTLCEGEKYLQNSHVQLDWSTLEQTPTEGDAWCQFKATSKDGATEYHLRGIIVRNEWLLEPPPHSKNGHTVVITVRPVTH